MKKTAQSAVFAAPGVLSSHGAELRTEKDGEERTVCDYKGWSFVSRHCTMIDSAELDLLQEEVTTGVDSDIHLHVPPMVFDNDVMKVECGNFAVEFRAKDALRVWAQKHAANSEDEVVILKVPYAKEWKEKSLFRRGFVDGSSGSSSGAETAAAEQAAQPVEPDSVFLCSAAEHTDTTSKASAWDWTFSSDYCGTISGGSAGGSSSSSSCAASAVASLGGLRRGDLSSSSSIPPPPPPPQPQPQPQCGINYDLLKSRTDPILFYDECVLYQDDLEDCGEVSFDAKLRVMPQVRCFIYGVAQLSIYLSILLPPAA